MNALPVNFRGALIRAAASLVFLLCCTASLAQESDPFTYSSRIRPSAQAWTVSHHGGMSPDLFTGAMAWSLPLYTYKDEDFTIPISLDYRFDGCRPSLPSGTVGLGWSLNCGGVITRTIVGLPDDFIRKTGYIDTDDELHESWEVGYYFAAIDHGYIPPLAIDDRLSMETYMNESYCIGQMSPVILDLGNNSLTMLMGASPLLSENYVFYRNGIIEGGPYFDPESDIYHFSLPDVSGDFVILSDGSIKVYNCTDPEGEISVQIHFSLLQSTSCSTRIIISRRGYRYEFGWDRNHLEYNYDTTLERYTDPTDPLRHCFSALFLNRIVAPNGRQVSFSRDAVSPCNSMLWKPAVKYRVSGITGQPKQTLPGLSNTISRPLQSIAVDGDTLVTFHYGNKSHAEFGYSSFQGLTISQYRHLSPLGQGPPQPDSTAGYNTANRLTSVTIHNREQNLIDSISLTHSYSSSQSGHSPKMFLRTVQGNAGRYTFEYEHASSSDAWPAINAENVTDHWGYWAGTGIAYSDNSSNRQQHSLYDLPSTAKEPDTLYTMYGALHRIGYPSGGCTLLSYEPNRVSRRIDIDAFATGSGDGSYYLDSCQNKLVGGVRIKKIVNQTGAAGSFCDSLVFDYCSSGILMRMPRYFIDASAAYHRRFWKYLENTGAWLIEDNYGDLTLSSFNNSGLSACGADGHVGYSKVRTRHGDGSFSEYIFSDISDYPDTYLHDYGESDGERFSILKAMVGNTQEEPEKRGFFIVSEPASQAEVNSNVRLAGICLADFSCMRGRPLSKKVYAADSSLVQAVRHTYHADSAAAARGVFNVFSNFIASGRTFIQPRLDSVITMEYLPGGGAVSDTTLYIYNALGQKTLTEHHGSDGSIRGIRLRYEHESDTTAPRANISEAASTRTGLDGTEYVTGFQCFAYDGDSARRHLPVLAMDYGRPVPWAVSAVPGTGSFAPPSPDDSLTRRLSYNEKHRPERLMLPAGAYVSFVWDTSGRYPLAREDNGPMMVSTYQWKDMVGLAVKTDPTLRSEWYAYDGKWRLAEVRRADSTRIMAYDYHLRCEDSTAGPSHIKRTTWRTSSKNNRDIIYYDGLGYPIQRVRTSIQTNGGHIVTPIRYDALRRDDVEAYLPYEAQYSTYNSADSIAQSQYYKLQFGNSEIYPYAKRTYGTSPAGRLLSSRKPGRDYADSAKVVTYDYRTNNAADSVLDLTVTVGNQPQLIAGTAFLPAGRLLLTKTTDEDGCTGEVFTNAAGRTVLSRQRTEGQRLDTYYVYDLRDSLVCVLQPEGAAAIQPGSSHTLLPPVARNAADTIPAIDAVLDKYAFLYAWDSRGRLAAKKRPGAKAEEYLYDDRGRVVLSRDGNLRTQGQWLYNEYDGYDALLKKSLVTVSLGLDTLRRAARGEIDSTVTVIRDTTWLWPYFGSQDPDMVVYGRTASLAAGDSLFCQGYDGFDYAGPADGAGNDPVLGHYVVFEMAYYYAGGTIGCFPREERIVTINTDWQAILADAITGSTLLEEHRYDRGDSPQVPAVLAFEGVTGIVSQGDKGPTRNMEVWQRQLMLPPGRTVPGDTTRYVERAFYYDVPGNLVQTVETNVLGGISRTSAKYDYLGNILVIEEKHTRANAAAADTKRTSYDYDNHGRVASEYVSVNSSTVNSTEFDYDIFGRLIYSRGEQGEEPGMAVQELYSYDIRGRLTGKETFRVLPYQQKSIGNDSRRHVNNDGDIDSFVFGQYLRYFNPVKQSSRLRWNGLISEIAHQHGENGPVITNGYFYDDAGRLTDNIRYDGTQQTDKFTERNLSFDRNGNILSLKRYGSSATAPQDNLSYTYYGNRLTHLNNTGVATYTYTYDNNGNTLTDSRRGLSFTWNHLDLPASITSNPDGTNATVVDYTYLADGTKALATTSNEGYAYLGTMTYRLSGGTWSLESVPFTGGRFMANSSGGFDEYRYITDHLGSTRVIVTGSDYHEVEQNDYYPFGMRIADNTLQTTASNRWRFSGKEIQVIGGIGLVDFGARLYDDFSGRWTTQDPLVEKTRELGLYSYCFNNSINCIDYFGLEVKPFSVAELEIIKNTLPEDARQYVVLNKNGYIDPYTLQQYIGEDLNYSNLIELVFSDMVVTLVLNISFQYCDPEGNNLVGKLSYLPPDVDLMDVAISSVSGLTTGEGGNYGKTLFPDRDGLQNSTTNNIEIYLHPSLSKVGASEAFSHEGYGHALLYIRTGGNHQRASHIFQTSPFGPYDANTVLSNMIRSSRRSTIQNLIK